MKLTEALIQKYVNEQSLSRGYAYYRNGDVDAVVRRGAHISGSVTGSRYEPYQIQIRLSNDDIVSAECDCPYDWGGYCKHIAAVLLHCMHNADEVEEKPTLETLLSGLSAGELLHMIVQIADEFPGLAEAIEREIGWLKESPVSGAYVGETAVSIDINAIRRELGKDFRSAASAGGYDSWGEYEMEVYPDEWLSPHLDKIMEALTAGALDMALAALTAVIETWIDGMDGLDEWVYEYNEDPLNDAASEMAVLLAEVLLTAELSPEERKEWQKRIGYWEDTISAMEIAATAVDDGWEYPPLVAAMQGNITQEGAWEGEAPWFADELTLARLRILARQERYQEYIHLAEAEGQTNLYINMLANIGEVETAVSDAKKYMVYPDHILHLAQILDAGGETEAALGIAAHGLTLEDANKTALARWLRGQAEGVRDDLALRAARAAFVSSMELDDYKAVARLAGVQWAEIKPQLLENLSQSQSITGKIDVYLYENMLIGAMKVIDHRSYYGYSNLDRVIAATKEQYPDWGIAKYKKQGEAIMDEGNAKAYETAVSWLRKARDIYLQHGRQAEWNAYLTSVLDKHHRKYKLVPMLKGIRNY